MDEYSTRFENEFSLLSCHSLSATSSIIWYIDSGATNHMTGVREHFTDLFESGLDVEVVLGDDTTVRVVGQGTVTF